MDRKLFAWWPTKMTSGKWIWLNTFYLHKSLYDINTGRPPLNALYFTWTETEKERVWRFLKESTVHNRNIWNDPELTKRDTL